MTLLSVRTLATKLSGRYDLINADGDTPESGTDAGMNSFINSGQRYLDMFIDNKKSDGTSYETLSSGSWYLPLQNVRALEDIWANNTTDRWQLERKPLSWMKSNYTKLVTDTDTGAPLYWAPALLRGVSVTNKDTLGAFFNYSLTQTGYENYSGLIILAPTDSDLIIEVNGKFWTPTLTADTDTSYWSEVHEMLLVWASLRQLEVSYRNREGAADWDSAIANYLMGLDKDEIQEQISSTDQLEG